MIAMQTLLSNVSREMQKGGPANAIDFCHLNATSLTDSLSKIHVATISRIAEKNRNPENLASAFEVSIMNELFAENRNDTVIKSDGQFIYYKNIKLGMPTCLKCHGDVVSEIGDSTYALIQDRYPNDKATYFKMGDLRGAWKIIFED